MTFLLESDIDEICTSLGEAGRQFAGKRKSETSPRAVEQFPTSDFQRCLAVFCRRLEQRIIHLSLLNFLSYRAA